VLLWTTSAKACVERLQLLAQAAIPAGPAHPLPLPAEAELPRARKAANPALPWSEMDEPSGSESTGMGPTPSGPSFVPWAPAPSDTPPIRPYPAPPRSSRSAINRASRRANLISAGVILLVAIVVAAASLVAHFADTHVSAPVASEQPIPHISAQGDRIQFTTSEGSGQLILLRHSWVTDGRTPPASGSYLRVEVELICDSGSVDYDPYNFQVFDHMGQLFETAIDGAGDSMLETGTLHAGERVRGTVAFDMPRGEATLLMSDDSNQTVTALKVPD
jgi:FlaG/FlaF family flagellin (archaellin)